MNTREEGNSMGAHVEPMVQKQAIVSAAEADQYRGVRGTCLFAANRKWI